MKPAKETAVHFNRRRRLLFALAVVSFTLWLLSLTGSIAIFCAFPRFFPAARRLIQQTETDEAKRQMARPSNEEIMRDQAILTLAAGEAIWAVAAVGVVSSLGMVSTLAWVVLSRRASRRSIEASLADLSRQLQEMQTGQRAQPAGPELHAMSRHADNQGSGFPRRVFLWLTLAAVLFCALAFACSGILQYAQKQKSLEMDSLLIKEMATARSGIAQAGDNFTLPTLGLELIWVAPGSFRMGGDGRYDGTPITKVTLTDGFWLGKYELKQEEYRAVMHRYPRGPSHSSVAGPEAQKDMPAIHVSWYMAVDFCRKLTQLAHTAGCVPPEYVFTLPTEAQWEYACRAGTTGEFAGEVDEMAWCARDHTGADNHMPWFGGSNKSGEHPVGRKKPNAWGFFDMQGNMSEWCLDRYAFKLPGGGVTNPAGPVSGEFRVKRGGNWMQSAEQCTSAARTGTSPIHRTTEGFRVALTLRRAELVAP